MRGISEKTLRDTLEEHCLSDFHETILKQLINECEELNPWIPIARLPPEHKRVLVIFDDGEIEIARWVGEPNYWMDNSNLDFNYGFDVPTHWQELPKDPK